MTPKNLENQDHFLQKFDCIPLGTKQVPNNGFSIGLLEKLHKCDKPLLIKKGI